MAFDVEAWVRDNLERPKPSAGAEWTATCPECSKHGGFYVNTDNGAYVCFKCDFKGKNVPRLIARVMGWSLGQARAFVTRSTVIFSRRKSDPATLAERIAAMREDVDEDDEAGLTVRAGLPQEMIHCFDETRKPRWKMPKYLKQRGIPKSIARQFNLGFVEPGVWYPRTDRPKDLYIGNRIIMPVLSPTGYSWTARALRSDARPKYLNAPGADHRRLLFGWDQVGMTSDVVLVEGPTDTLNLHRHGLPGLGLMGKVLNLEQLQLLRKRPKTVACTIMLDPEELTAPYEVAAQALTHFTDVRIAWLVPGPDGLSKRDSIDPGNGSNKELWGAYDDAETYDRRDARALSRRLARLAT